MIRWWRRHVGREWRVWGVLLGLGVVTNVLVVGWIEWRGAPATVSRSYLFSYGGGIWMMMRYESQHARTEHWFARQVVFPDTSDAERRRLVEMYRDATPMLWEDDEPQIVGPMAAMAKRPMTSETSVRFQRLVGWPFVSMASTWRPKTAGAEGAIDGAADVRVTQGRSVRMPIVPVWPGFLWNSLVFGGLWALALVLALAPRKVRRLLRVRGGRCPGCGYDLVGKFAAGCSECGWGRQDERVREAHDG